jgi:polar amino acid transport system substrate-binding protein
MLNRLLRPAALLASAGAITLLASACGSSPTSTSSSAPTYPALASSQTCTQLRSQNPDLAGKTLTDAINPHTPGYESISVTDPTKYEGFDVDLSQALGECLGFKVSYLPVAFDALLPTLQSGQANFIISDIYATKERAASADFVTYSKVFAGVLAAAGNPKKITGIDDSLCGTTTSGHAHALGRPLLLHG